MDGLKEYAGRVVSDDMWDAREIRFPEHTPRTREVRERWPACPPACPLFLLKCVRAAEGRPAASEGDASLQLLTFGSPRVFRSITC